MDHLGSLNNPLLAMLRILTRKSSISSIGWKQIWITETMTMTMTMIVTENGAAMGKLPVLQIVITIFEDYTL